MSRCTLCEAVVEWRTTRSGIRLPIDPTPHPAGALSLLPTGELLIIPMEERETFVGTRYRSHFSTCPVQAAAKQGHVKPKAKS
jgi:hypothetical protein